MDIEKVERTMVFSAHPDDEILGVGGTITRLSKQGAKVTVAIFSLEETAQATEQSNDMVMEARKKETRTAAGILGVQETVFLGKSPNGDANHSSVYQQCIKLIRKHRPQVIFTHFQHDKNRDHRTISEVVGEACSKAGENILPDIGKAWSTPYLYYYELSDLLAYPSDIVDITGTIESKLKAVKTQKSHFGTMPETTEYLRALARVRGHTVGVQYGEAFLLSSLTPCKH